MSPPPTWSRDERLYQRLPQLYRERDREQGEPLRAFLAVVETQIEAIEDDIAGLYENLFLDTCEDWVIPYLADLLGIEVLGDAGLAGAHPRAQVARALGYRERKGTPGVLEQVSRDVLGWPARVVEQRDFLAHTQNVTATRPGQGGWLDVRQAAEAPPEDPFHPPLGFHSAETRRISSRRGRFNIPNLALHLWRLGAFPLAQKATVASLPVGATALGAPYLVDPLGRDLALFNRPPQGEPDERASTEERLPLPLQRESLDRDLQAYRQLYVALPPAERLAASDFYGTDRFDRADRALWASLDGITVPPAEVVARNLDGWGRIGLLSGALSTFPSLSAAAPEIGLTLGPAGPFFVRLGSKPANLAAARGVLERAIQGAATDPRFRNARVVVVGSRLLLVSGEPGDRVIAETTPTDPTTATQLTLTLAAGAQGASAAWSGDLAVFPPLPGPRPSLSVTIGNVGPRLVELTRVPTSCEDARDLLEAAIHAAAAGSTHFGNARVLRFDRRLVVLGGDPTAVVRITTSTTDSVSAAALDLAFRLAVDPELGRLLLAPGVTVPAVVRVQYAYGAASRIGGGSYDRRPTLTDPASVSLVLNVEQGKPLPILPTLTAALAQWVAQGRPDALIRVNDSELYAETPSIVLAPGSRLFLEAADTVRPVLRPAGPIEILGGGEDSRLVINGFLIDGTLELAGSLRLSLLHSTLVPQPGRGSLAWAGGDATDLRVEALSSIVGALQLPGEMAALELTDSLLDAASPSGGAAPLPALVSAALVAPLPASGRLKLTVRIGTTTVTVRLADVPGDLASARGLLEQAIRAAGGSPGVSGARVSVVGGRLLVRSGTNSETVSVTTTADDPHTAVELALVTPPAVAVDGLLSGDLQVFPAFAHPEISSTIGGGGAVIATLAASPADLDQAASLLQSALRAFSSRPAFAAAQVIRLDERLLVRPGEPGAAISFATTITDTDTPARLGLLLPAAFGPVEGVFSGSLATFPAFASSELAVKMGSTGPLTVPFGGLPTTVAQAATALAAALLPSFPGSSVVDLGDHLLVRPATVGVEVSFAATAADPTTAGDLALITPPATAVRGRLSSSLAPFPSFVLPQVAVTLDGEGPHVAVLAGLPTGLGTARELLEAAIRGAHPSFAEAQVRVLDDRLWVRSRLGTTAVTITAAALDTWTAADLGLTAPPATPLLGLLSGDPGPFQPFLYAQLNATFGSDGPRLLTFASFPTTIDGARSELEVALQNAPGGGAAFTAATVLRVGSRLLVVSGTPADLASFDIAPGDPLTVPDLGLAAPPAVAVPGLLSGSLFPLPVLFAPRVLLTIGSVGPRPVILASVPADLDQARALLETAIRRADPGSRFRDATVVRVGGRLLVAPGIAGNALVFAPAPEDATTVDDLALRTPTAETVAGLISADLTTFPTFPPPRVRFTIGGSTQTVQLAGLPTDLDQARSQLETALRAITAVPTFQSSTVLRLGNRLLVKPGVVGDGAAAVAPPEDATTAADLSLVAPAAERVFLSGDLASFPSLPRPQLALTLGAATQTVTLSGLPADLATARTQLEAAIQATGVPSFSTAVVLGQGNRLVILPGTAANAVSVATTGTDATTAGELALASPGGSPRTGLLSGTLSPFPAMTAAPAVDVTIGATTATATLATVPTDLASAATALQAAIRAAAAAAAFTGALVLTSGSRLLVLPGATGVGVTFAAATSNPQTVVELKLGTGVATVTEALLGGSLATFPALTIAPQVQVTLGGDGPHLARLTAIPTSLATAATQLQAAIRSAAGTAIFTTAVVEVFGTRLRIRPGTGPAVVAVSDPATGPPTATSLALVPAVAIDGLLGGDLPAFSGLRATPRIVLTAGSGGSAVTATATFTAIPTTLAQAQSGLEAALRAASGNPAFTGATVRLLDGARLLVTAGGSVLPLSFANAATGPATATLLGLAAGLGVPAVGLLSGDTTPFGITVPPLAVDATIGSAGTHTTFLPRLPADLADLAAILQQALRGADGSPSFTQAEVYAAGDRLLVLPGVNGDPVAFTPAAVSPTVVATLKLDAASASVTRGLLSGPLAASLRLRIQPAANVTLGSLGPRLAALTAPPQTLAAAAPLLQAAIRAAGSEASFTGATVTLRGGRLQVISGVPADSVLLTDPTTGGPGLVVRLALDPGRALAGGILSGPLAPFPALRAIPRLRVTAGGVERTVTLGALPGDLATAQTLLEAAIRTADPSGAAFGAATVRVLGSRLLATAGDTSGAISFLDVTGAVPAATRLGLAPGERGDGLLSGSLAGFTGLSGSAPSIDVTLGGDGPYRATLTAVPASLATAASLLQTALRNAHPTDTFTQATVQVVDNRLLLTAGRPQDAVVLAASATSPTTLATLRLRPEDLVAAGGYLGARLAPFVPRTLPQLSATLGAAGTRVVTLPGLPTDLLGAALLLEQALRLGAAPGSAFANAEVRVLAGRLLVRSPGVFAGTIAFAGTPGDGLSVFLLKLDAGEVVVADGLLSGDLTSFPHFSGQPKLLATIDGDGPHTVILPSLPTTLAQARDSLEAGLRAAHNSPAFYLARVVLAGNRLVVLPGRPGPLVLAPHPDDPTTISDLGFGVAGSRGVGALLSGPLPAAVTLSDTAPELAVAFTSPGTTEAFTAGLASPGGLLAAIAANLQAAIRAAGTRAASTAALVAVADGERLVIVPGEDGFSVGLGATSTDTSTARELALEVGRAVGTSATDDEPGPPMSIVRSTVFGRVVIRELTEASDSLFAEPLRVLRRHVGSVRFSYLPDGSETPRRFRCQPDLALDLAIRQALEARARELGLTSFDALPAAERSAAVARERVRVLARLAPRWTSTRFGDAGYGQLVLGTAEEILAGAEDGAEMGVGNQLAEPRRRRQLEALMAEYLRFGLDIGFFFET